MGQTDPLLLLSAVVPVKYGEYLYAFIAIFRVYLAGLSFSFLCFYFRKRAMHALIGSVVYCFCGYAILCSMRHTYFINPMILLPLLIVGIDKILKKEKPYLFIWAMFYAALCGFYHLYMMTIMLFVYALVRFFDLYKEQRFNEFLRFVGRGTSGYLLGCGIAAFIFLPSIMYFLNGTRVGSSIYNGAYAWTYYPVRLLRLIAPPGSWNDMAFAAIALFALVLLFFSKGKRTVKICTVMAFAFLLTSVGGFIMNGFQYPSNRWTFGLALMTSYVVVEMLPDLLNLSRKQQIISIGVLIFYTTACFARSFTRKLTYIPVGAIFLALTLLVLLVSLKEDAEQVERRKKGSMEKSMNRWRECLCLLLVIANVGVNGIYKFAADQGNYVRVFEKSGTEISMMEKAIERELEPYLLNMPEGRGDGSQFYLNRSMVWRIPGLLAYHASLSRDVVSFWESVECNQHPVPFCIETTEQRTILNTLQSVKYQVEPQQKADYIPFGYAEVKKTKKGNVIYENKYALPWGYTYDHAISYGQLEQLNGLEKQEAMLQAIALDEESAMWTKLDGVQFDEIRVPYEIICKDCVWKDGTLTVLKPNATVTLNFDMPSHVEGYLRLNQFDINNSRWNSYLFRVKCNNISRHTCARSRNVPGNSGRQDYISNLGYSEQKRNSLTIIFPLKGKFKLKNIELFALPMDNYPARVEALRAEPLENIKWDTNRLSGTVDLSKDKILCVSVPYSKGWSATVDGKKAKILRGNYMFMALPLKAGHHDIKFSYCTPGLKLGAVLSALSACIVAGMFMRDRRRRKNVG